MDQGRRHEFSNRYRNMRATCALREEPPPPETRSLTELLPFRGEWVELTHSQRPRRPKPGGTLTGHGAGRENLAACRLFCPDCGVFASLTNKFEQSSRAEEGGSRMRAVDAIMECLKAEGVDAVFGIPGGANLPTYDALYDAGIRNILCRHEQGAGHAAEGYAKASGQGGRRARHLGPRRDQPRHGDRRRDARLGADRVPHGPGAHRPDGHRRLPGGRHGRHHDAGREALLPGARPARDPAHDPRGLPRRPHRAPGARARGRPAGRLARRHPVRPHRRPRRSTCPATRTSSRATRSRSGSPPRRSRTPGARSSTPAAASSTATPPRS